MSATPNGSAKMINGSNSKETHAAPKHSVSSSKSDDSNQPVAPANPPLPWLFSAKHGVQSSLVSLVFITFASLAVAFLCTQLLYRLNDERPEFKIVATNFFTTQDLAVAITSFALALDVCCALVCSLQLFFALKLLRYTQGDDRWVGNEVRGQDRC